MKRKLVDFIVNSGLVERADIQRCVLRARMNEDSTVVDEMVERLDVDEQKLASLMAEFWGLDCSKESTLEVMSESRGAIARDIAEQYGVLPLENRSGDGFKIAVYDVEKARPVIERIRDQTGTSPVLVVSGRSRLKREIARYYDGRRPSSGGTPDGARGRGSAPGQGVVRKNDQRRERPERTTKRSGEAGPEATSSSPNSDDAGPTRQVDVGSDNPFMDLVDETTRDGTPQRSSSQAAPPTRAVEDAPVELFDDGPGNGEGDADGGGVDSSTAKSAADSEPASGEPSPSANGGEPAGLAGALEQFDAELADEESEDEPELAASTSSVNWGQYQDNQSAFPGLEGSSGSGSRPDGAAGAPDSSGVGSRSGSGVFPVDHRESDDFFDFDEQDSEQEDLTLAEVVERQRQIIDKLEREIDYQKGILRTVAELLVDSRVISKSKLKNRIKEFRADQQRGED